MDINQLLKTVEALRNADPCITTIFTHGGCYQFYLFVKTLNERAVPMIDSHGGHVASMLDGCLLDINGLRSDADDFERMNPELEREAENWSFSRSKYLSFGECPNCEEPLLHVEEGE